jgi:DNA-binding response OmpR family regulator
MGKAAGPTRVLVVEDDPMVAELLMTRLELAGYHASVARDGAVAIRTLHSESPDAVILDLNLPQADGFDVLRFLNGRTGVRQPRVMVVSARRSEHDVQRCLSLGASDYVSKPFDDRVFLKRVARLTRPPVEPSSLTVEI